MYIHNVKMMMCETILHFDHAVLLTMNLICMSPGVRMENIYFYILCAHNGFGVAVVAFNHMVIWNRHYVADAIKADLVLGKMIAVTTCSGHITLAKGLE